MTLTQSNYWELVKKKSLFVCSIYRSTMFIRQKDLSRKFEFLEDCPPYFNICTNLEKQGSS